MAGFRLKKTVWALALVVVFLASLCFAVSHFEIYSPIDVARALGLALQLVWESLVDPSALTTQMQRIAEIPCFYEVRTRFLVSVLTGGCGAMLALAGALYQWVFRNPIAAPTMLGVNNGVSIGVLLLVLQYGSAAQFMTGQRYLYCFVGAVVILALVTGITFIASRAGGGKRKARGKKGNRGKRSKVRRPFSVITMLLVASIISQLIGAVMTYVTATMDDAQLLTYTAILQMLNVNVEPLTFAVLGITVLVGCVPLAIMGFSLNALALPDEEAHTMGVNLTPARIAALAMGTVMIVSCEVLTGTVSMVSLFVPFIARAQFGAEFRRQTVGNVLIGAVVLLVCRTIAGSIPFVGDGFPLGVVVSLVSLPFFVAIVVTKQRTWE